MKARIASVGAAVAMVLALAIAVHSQPGKTFRIGFLGTTSPKAPHGAFVEAFRDGLRERGFVEGKNLTIESRWADNDYARLPALAAELVRLNVDLILTHGSPAGRAVKEATTTIPVVIAIVGDAVATGLVQSMARPGGNITGTSFFSPELNAKRIEILKEALPGLRRIGVLVNESNAGNVATVQAMTATARTVKAELVPVSIRSVDDFDRAFVQVERSRADALVVYDDPLFITEAARVAALAERHRLPSIGSREYADGGGLLAFGVDFPAVWSRAATFVDRIFKGARPADLPMEQPTKYATVVNLKTAKALRLTIAPRVLMRANAVIE